VKPWEDVYNSTPALGDMLRWAATHEQLIEQLAACERVLEIGTGTGMLSALLSHFCSLSVTLDANAQVLDASRPFLTLARATVPAVLADAFELPIRDHAFDAVFSQGLLEHFADAQIRALVAAQLRAAPRVLASVPSRFYPHARHFGPGLIGNERLLSARKWRRILAEFDVRTTYYADFKVLTVAGKVLPWPTQLLLDITAKA